MTVNVGRKTINLGWETAVAVILFLIYNTYAGTKYIINAEADRAAISKDVKEIKASLKILTGRDSVYTNRFSNLNRRVDSLAAIDCYVPPKPRNGRVSFVYEFRDKNGRIILKPVK